MAIHYPTPPLGGGERPCLPSAQVGPVTQAIRAMRRPSSGELCHLNEPARKSRKDCDSTAFGHSAFTLGIRALSRAEIEDLIGGLIDLLDAMDGDPDAEPDADREPSLCGLTVSWPYGGGDDRENDTADHEASHQPLHMGGGGYSIINSGRAA